MDRHYEPKVSGTLLEATMELVKKSGKNDIELHVETRIPYYWLKRFIKGGFVNPSVNRVQFLYEHLSGTELKIEATLKG